MTQAGIKSGTIALTAGASFLLLWAAGCGPSKEVKSLKEQNQALTQRIAELEGQLKQANTAAAVPPTTVQASAPVSESLYTVVEGDNLWSIAKKKLGSGARYKEILALNPHIIPNKPLAIGTQLKLPPQ